jgi:hypothetical protein
MEFFDAVMCGCGATLMIFALCVIGVSCSHIFRSV